MLKEAELFASPRVSSSLDLRATKAAFTTRRVLLERLRGLDLERAPRPGDVVLARVESIGQHDGLQTPAGRRAKLHVGDEILVCYGNRYAVNQWEAVVPPTLAPCDLVAAGGVAGKVRSRHASARRPTGLVPLGLVVDEHGATVNLRQSALSAIRSLPTPGVPVIAVVGTSMDAGKTTTACAIISGLVRGGLRVAGIKVTGTGACGDYFQMLDAGASWVADFVDVGFVSTYQLEADQLLLAFTTLVGHACASGAEVIVLEVADGLVQRETTLLLNSAPFHAAVDAVLLAAGDSFGAKGAARWLLEAGLPLRAISGIVSSSTLSALEASELTGLPVLGVGDLCLEGCGLQWIDRS